MEHCVKAYEAPKDEEWAVLELTLAVYVGQGMR